MEQQSRYSTDISFREKQYRMRAGTINYGRDYEIDIIALLSLRCIRQGVEDMWLAANVDGAGDFDDIVLHVKTKDNDEKTFMIQLKHRHKPISIKDREFLSPKGDFSLVKYFKSIEMLHKTINAESQKLNFVKDIGSFNNIYFVLFTNTGIDKSRFFEKDDITLSILNTSHITENAYRFNAANFPESLNESIASSNLYSLPNQVNSQEVEKQIVMEIMNFINHLGFSKHYLEDISRRFVKYVSDWSKGYLGGYFYLTKQNILFTLTELLFNCYKLKLENELLVNCYTEENIIWKQISDCQTITIIELDDIVLNFLIKYLSSEVGQFCDKNVKTWNDDFSEEEQMLFYQKYPAFKEEILQNVGHYGKICPTDIYKCLWKINKVPLLLKINNSQDYENILSILELSNYAYKVIILSENVELLPRKQNEVQPFKYLLDLDEESVSKILMQEVSIQGRHGARLKDLVNKSMFHNIKCSDIVHILSGNFNIGSFLEPLPNYFIGRSIVKRAIKSEVLEKVDAIFLLSGHPEQLFNIVSKHKCTMCKLEDIDFNNLLSISGIIEVEGDINSEQLEKLKSIRKSIHILNALDNSHFEWKWSYGSSEIIEHFQVELEYALERGVTNNLLNTITILCGDPGSGKSVLIDYVAHQVPINKWVLKINLCNHQLYFRKQESETGASNHLLYFYDALECNFNSNAELVKQVFQRYINLKNVIVLFDGFDEVFIYKDRVTNIIQSLHKEGFQIWITTRPNMKAYVEETFTLKSIEIKPLTIDNQKLFLQQFFSVVHADLNVALKLNTINRFVNELLEIAHKNLNDKTATFTESPLQIRLLAEAFSEECKKCISSGTVKFDNNFDMLYLYQSFIHKKTDILANKYGISKIDVKVIPEQHQSLLALKFVFPLHNLEELDVMKEVDYYYKNEPENIQLLQIEGIVRIDDKKNINFVHRTFAEYLSALWLTRNIHNSDQQVKKVALDLIQERFTQKHTFLFTMFDRLFSKSIPLHLAILNKQVDQIKKIIHSDAHSINRVDESGRSALHIAALNSFQYPLPYDASLSKSNINDDIMLNITKHILDSPVLIEQIDLMGYSPLDYALANCSLSTANEIYTKLQNPLINICINLNFKFDYFRYCSDHYPELFKILLPYFASRDLMLKNVHAQSDIAHYTRGLYIEHKGKTLLQLLHSEFGRVYSGYTEKDISYYYADLRFAIAFGSKRNVDKLLFKIDDINKQDVDKCIPLHYAVSHGRSEVVEMLLDRGAEINKTNNDNNTPLCLAILEKDINMIKLLHSRGAKFNIGNALHLLAQQFGDSSKGGEFVRELIRDEGADINRKNKRGETILFQAVKKDFIYLIKQLLRCGASVNERDNNGETALHWTAIEGRVYTARLLCMNNANVNVINSKGLAPLHLATLKGNKDMILFLISNEADIKLTINNGDTPLHLASMKGHLDATKLLIAKGSNVQAENNCKNTPLHLTCGNGYTKIAVLLLKKGALVNAVNLDGNTSLHLVSINGHVDTADLLITMKADVYANNLNNDTPLHLASQHGHIEITNLLVDKGVFVNAENLDGNTPLHMASLKGHMDTVKFLSVMQAKVSRCNKNGDTPLHFAAQNGHTDVVSHFISQGVDANSQTADGNTPLHLASRKGHTDTAQLLITMGADINVYNKNGDTSLHLACIEGYTDTAMSLVNLGADVNARNKNGDTPLHLASVEGYAELVMLLASTGADVMARNMNGDTPLHSASRKGNSNAINSLLSSGADAKKENVNGDTPLHLASQNGHIGIINVLLSSVLKADYNEPNRNGDTPLHLASRNGDVDMIKLLLMYGANINIKNEHGETPLHLAVVSGSKDAISLIVTHGADIDAHDQNVFTPLHYAVQNNKLSIIDLLVTQGAYVETTDLTGSTVLHMASQYGHMDTIQLLLNYCIDIDIKDETGNTPLHLTSIKGYSHIAELLINNGANINVKNNHGNTVLHQAIINNQQDIVFLLLTKGAKINEQNINNKTALEMAVDNGDTEILKLLLSTTIDNNCKFQQLRQPQLPNFRISVDHELAENCPLHLAIMNGNLKEIEKIIASDSNILALVDKAGRSVLHVLANYGVQHTLATFYTDKYETFQEPIRDNLADFVDEILESLGTDFQFDDVLGYNPLDYALARGSLVVADRICSKLGDLPINIDLHDKKMYFTICGIYEYNSLFKTLVNYFASRTILCKHLSPTMNSFIIKDCENAIFLIANGQAEIMESFDGIMQRIRLYTEQFGAKAILDVFQLKSGTYDDLRFAVSFGTIENVEELLSTNWEIDKQDVDKNTALHYAVICNCSNSVLQLFLQKGANINKQGKYGNTPLHFAVRKAGGDVISTLLENDAKIDIKNNFGETPLHITVKNGLLEITEILLSNKAKVHMIDEYGRTPLHYAADRNHLKILKLLLDKDDCINQDDHAENTALIYAARGCHEECVKLLMSKKADITKQGFLGRTALHWATYNNSFSIASILLKNNKGIINIDAKDDAGNTSLHFAVRTCNKNLVDLLLSAGADVNIQNNQGETALHCACNRYNVREYEDGDEDGDKLSDPLQHEEIVKQLLRQADVNVADCYGNTALHCAVTTVYKIKRYFQENDDDYENYAGALKCYKIIICALLDSKTNIDIQNNNKSTILHLAAKYGDIETTKLLIFKHANTDIVDDDGNIPLHLAAQEGYDDIVEILIKNKDTKVQNHDGDTPLDLALKNDHSDTVKLLQ